MHVVIASVIRTEQYTDIHFVYCGGFAHCAGSQLSKISWRSPMSVDSWLSKSWCPSVRIHWPCVLTKFLIATNNPSRGSKPQCWERIVSKAVLFMIISRMLSPLTIIDFISIVPRLTCYTNEFPQHVWRVIAFHANAEHMNYLTVSFGPDDVFSVQISLPRQWKFFTYRKKMFFARTICDDLQRRKIVRHTMHCSTVWRNRGIIFRPYCSALPVLHILKLKKKKHNVTQTFSLPKIFCCFWNHISKQFHLHPSNILISS